MRIFSSSLRSRVRLTPAAGSSSSTSLASVIIVRPSSSSFFCPPERLPARSSATCSSSRKASVASAFSRTASSAARTLPAANQLANRFSPGWADGTIIRFSRALRLWNSCGIWKVRTRPLWKSASVDSGVTSSPRKRMVPDVGCRAPAMRLNSVVLPAPLGPMRPRISPLLTLRVQPSTARKPPKALTRPSTSSIASVFPCARRGRQGRR